MQSASRRWMYVHTLLALLLFTGLSYSQERLKYIGRFDFPVPLDHLMGVETIWDDYALVSASFGGLELIDLRTLPPDGTKNSLAILGNGGGGMTSTTTSDNYCYLNLLKGGFKVVYVDPVLFKFTQLATIEETDVFYEKMAVAGDRLYVAAHTYGIRIFDISDRANPVLVSSLATGFTDAWSIAVNGNRAYVADGAGGLKIVDISDEANPVILEGEDPEDFTGAAEDVLVLNNKVYVAGGGSGVGVYSLDTVQNPVYHDTPRSAKDLAVAGNYLAAADIGGVEVFKFEADGGLQWVARESARRRHVNNIDTARLWYGVSGWGSNRFACANWDNVDVYEVVDPDLETQPDITASTQRIRFHKNGGTENVLVTNDGSGPLNISSIYSDASSFTVQPSSAILQPGEDVMLQIDYLGGNPGEAHVWLDSDDPDENPLPIQIYGKTVFLDPGEDSVPFALETWKYDRDTDQFDYGAFDLSKKRGKFVFLHIFGSW